VALNLVVGRVWNDILFLASNSDNQNSKQVCSHTRETNQSYDSTFQLLCSVYFSNMLEMS